MGSQKKSSRPFLLAALVLLLGGIFLPPTLRTAFAQVTYWEMFCADQLRTTPGSGGVWVTCYNADATATAAVTPSTTAQPPPATATQPPATATNPAPGGHIIVDHNSVALFEQIPTQYLTAARNLKVLFSDRSVGQNFHEGLDCLTASSFGAAPASCRKDYDQNGNIVLFNQADYDAGRVPAGIRFAPSPTLYNRSNFVFESRVGSWSDLTCDFIQSMAPAHMDKDVLSYQFSYLNVTGGSNIMNFWNNSPNTCDIYDLEAFIAQHPEKIFIFWTASLARSIGTQEAQQFNDRMRQYARDNGKILFDFAAVESHTPAGAPCYDNRDGVPFTSPASGEFENYVDDGLNIPAICQNYTSEANGGHLGSPSGALIREGKAFWVLLAQVAGWRP